MPPSASERPPVRVVVELVLGNLSAEPTPATIVARFDEPSPTGAAWVFDRALGGHIARALEQGAISSRLGRLFPLPVPAAATLPPPTKLVLLVGMGTPERFGRDELRLMLTNATAALVDLGYHSFGTLLIGSGAGGVPPGQVTAALLEGIADGLNRVPPAALPEELRVKVVAKNEERLKEHLKHFLAVQESDPNWINLEVASTYRTQTGYTPKPTAPAAATTGDAADESVRVSVLLPDPPADRSKSPFARVQFSAVGAGAVLPVREVEVQTFFTDRLPGLFSRRPPDRKDPDPFGRSGRLLSNYLLPEEVRGVMTDSKAVTLVVDRRTAALPWEMTALDRRTGGRTGPTRFLGIDPGVCRQFRSLAGGLATPPPLNQSLRVLVIADPAGNLPGARAEGLAVAHTLHRLRERRGKKLDVKVTVRIGPPGGDGEHLQAARALGMIDERAADGELVIDAGPCDPMEVLGLIADVEYDVIHFAGHGGLVDERSGWQFAGCVFSAAELIRARRAPRLVFANACHSNDMGADTRERQLDEQAGLAECFFARGVHNYIGTGWAVADDPARELAVAFYDKLLLDPTDRQAVIGVALREARKRVKQLHAADPTWGAYQHYGPWNDKLTKPRDPT